MSDGCSTGLVRCTACKEVMGALDFNVHDCPMNPGPPTTNPATGEGETWDEYKARCEAFRAKQREVSA